MHFKYLLHINLHDIIQLVQYLAKSGPSVRISEPAFQHDVIYFIGAHVGPAHPTSTVQEGVEVFNR